MWALLAPVLALVASAGAYLRRYAQKLRGAKLPRRLSNGEQVRRVAALAMKRGKSVDFSGYWQRHVAAD